MRAPPDWELRILNFVSITIGIVALVFVATAFLPLLGWGNWLVVPLAIQTSMSVAPDWARKKRAPEDDQFLKV